MELFAKIVNDSKSLTISAKSSILDVWQGSGYASNTNREIHIECNQLDCVIKKLRKATVLWTNTSNYISNRVL